MTSASGASRRLFVRFCPYSVALDSCVTFDIAIDHTFRSSTSLYTPAARSEELQAIKRKEENERRHTKKGKVRRKAEREKMVLAKEQ